MAWHDAGGLPATVCFFFFFDTCRGKLCGWRICTWRSCWHGQRVEGELRRKPGQEEIKGGRVMVEGGLVVGLALNASIMARKEVHDTTT